MLLEWDEKYSIKIESLDSQHQAIFRITNEFSEALDNKKEPSVLEEIWDSMMTHAKDHFLFEEKYMRDCHYPELDRHAKQHQSLLDTLQKSKSKLKDDIAGSPRDMAKLLKTWWTSHILIQDMKLGTYCQEQEIKK